MRYSDTPHVCVLDGLGPLARIGQPQSDPSMADLVLRVTTSLSGNGSINKLGAQWAACVMPGRDSRSSDRTAPDFVIWMDHKMGLEKVDRVFTLNKMHCDGGTLAVRCAARFDGMGCTVLKYASKREPGLQARNSAWRNTTHGGGQHFPIPSCPIARHWFRGIP